MEQEIVSEEPLHDAEQETEIQERTAPKVIIWQFRPNWIVNHFQKRKAYTLHDKLDAIRRFETEFNKNYSEAERKMLIGRSIYSMNIAWAILSKIAAVSIPELRSVRYA